MISRKFLDNIILIKDDNQRSKLYEKTTPLMHTVMGKRQEVTVVQIQEDDLSGMEIADFLEEHVREMKAVSPPESKHALDLDGLRKPKVTFWTVWNGSSLIGCGAIKELSVDHAEVKSMRTSVYHRGKGVASMLLQHILNEAKLRGYRRISLETGSMRFFDPARNLYTKYGFKNCAPFSTYKEDPNSVFMTKEL